MEATAAPARLGAPLVEVLGVRVHAAKADEIAEQIGRCVAARQRLRVANHNLHSVYLAHTDPAIRPWYDAADLIYADGMPLVAAARLRRLPLRREHRMTLLDGMYPIWERADAGRWKVFLLGGRAGVADAFAREINRAYPRVEFATVDGYFTDSAAVVDTVNAFGADVVMVGLGMPLQERWLAEQADRLHATVLMPVGGLFDYVAGVTRTPPRWMGRVGLEWLHRLVHEPVRLGHRYLLEPVVLAGILLRQGLVSSVHRRPVLGRRSDAR